MVSPSQDCRLAFGDPNLFTDKLDIEEASDLRFMLCLITSNRAEIQDFILKFMTTTLQRYLGKCLNTVWFK